MVLGTCWPVTILGSRSGISGYYLQKYKLENSPMPTYFMPILMLEGLLPRRHEKMWEAEVDEPMNP